MTRKTNRNQTPKRKGEASRTPEKAALQALREGRPERALAWAREVVDHFSDPAALLTAATIFSRNGLDAEATRIFHQLMENHPDVPDFRFAYASTRAEQGRMEEAIRNFEMLLERPLVNPGAATAFTSILETKGRKDLALSVLQNASAHFPDDVSLRLEIGRLLVENGDPRRGAEILEQSLGDAAVQPAALARGWHNLGLASEQVGNDEAAEKAYRNAVRTGAATFRPVKNLALLYSRQGRTEDALTWLEACLPGFPGETELIYLQATLQRQAGQSEAAIHTLQVLVNSFGNHSGGWELLGRTLSDLGRNEEAVAVYRRWLSVVPGHPVATHMLAAASGEGTPERCSTGYIGEAFNRFSDSFEDVLTRLEYRGPAVFQQLLNDHLGPPQKNRNTLDGGCGTGWIGPVLRPWASRLTGVDLADSMLERARSKDCYDELHCHDLLDWLEQHPETYDLILVADTLVYFGNLEPVLKAAMNALQVGGWLLFNLEEGGLTEEGYHLMPHGRYVHGPPYVMQTLGELGVPGGTIRRMPLRKENEHQTFHLLIAVQKPEQEPPPDQTP